MSFYQILYLSFITWSKAARRKPRRIIIRFLRVMYRALLNGRGLAETMFLKTGNKVPANLVGTGGNAFVCFALQMRCNVHDALAADL